MKVMQKMAQGWSACCNYTGDPNGRIWLIWKNHLKVDILEVQDQFIHCVVEDPRANMMIYVTVVYARNESLQRDRLWIVLTQEIQHQYPWLLCGDFNNVLGSEDWMGSLVTQAEI